ncbi:hypothetical protein MTO96_002463 [Rhipicephalus appendiculatus]
MGLAFISTVCTVNFVGLGEDNPGLYTGMHTMTHEIAHILGAEHDGDPPKVQGHPGASNCPWRNGNIMSYIDNGPTHHQFSACSLRQFQYVVTLAGPQCWRVINKGYKLDHVYSGMVVSLDMLCKELINEPEAIMESSIVLETCKIRCNYYKLQLTQYNGYYYYTQQRYYKDDNAYDYMGCGKNKVCIQGVCVEKPSTGAGNPGACRGCNHKQAKRFAHSSAG